VKVLFLASFPVEAACTRYRCTQYFDYLRRNDVECALRPFLSPELFRTLYQRSGHVAKAAQLSLSALRRLRDVAEFARTWFDVVFVQREAALFGPPYVEWFVTRIWKKPMVFDFDDAIFVPYISPTYGRFAALLKFPHKTATNIRLSRHVIAGNNYLADYAKRLNANVTIIPTVVDASQWTPKHATHNTQHALTIGWIGSPTTTQYLKPLLPMLDELSHRHKFTLKIVGANETFSLNGTPVQNERWQLEREIADFQSLDIGMYPITEDEWSVGKSGFKAIQYMAAGVPCVASPVGVNKDIVQDGVNGFLAATPQEWTEKLSLLIEDAALRHRLGAAGRQTVENWYSLQAQAPRLLEILRGSKGK
jgi:glycosyltransferase involved in cell wall biosynthesis